MLENIVKLIKNNLIKTSETNGFKYLEINITEHCNLNCQCCTHFSPLAEKEFLSLEDFEKQIKKLAEITNCNIETISIMGGEPLLNPNCSDILKLTQNTLPNTGIQLVTNGILLTSQSENFWQTMKECNIVLRPTKYPIDLDWNTIMEIVQKNNIKFCLYNESESEKTSYKFKLLDYPANDYKNNFNNCLMKKCTTYSKGRIYPCPVAANIHHFNKYFRKNIPVSDKNYIDLFKIKDIRKVHKFLSNPIPLCKYCQGSKISHAGLWKRSEFNILEWT